MAKGHKTGGRKAGTPNRLSGRVKEDIERTAIELGGWERLLAWVKEDPLNERAFWTTMYTKLLPVQHTGEGGGPVQQEITEIRRIIVSPRNYDREEALLAGSEPSMSLLGSQN